MILFAKYKTIGGCISKTKQHIQELYLIFFTYFMQFYRNLYDKYIIVIITDDYQYCSKIFVRETHNWCGNTVGFFLKLNWIQ